MSTEFKPMLAAEGELGSILYPKYALPKVNGVRALVQRGQLIARSLKPIPNKHVRSLLSRPELEGMEGELTCGPVGDPNVFNTSHSAVMTQEGEPDVRLWVFDMFHPTKSFMDRIEEAAHKVEAFPEDLKRYVRVLPFRVVGSDAEVEAYAEEAEALGYEGLVLRAPLAPYKQGRSTAIEQGFMRFCPWLRSEAKILSIQEGKVNQNTSVRNELGYLKKSTHKENMVGSGQAGSVTVEDLKTKKVFNVAVPTDALQKEVWAHPENYLQALLKYKYKPPSKVGGAPRFPQWEGVRNPLDM